MCRTSRWRHPHSGCDDRTTEARIVWARMVCRESQRRRYVGSRDGSGGSKKKIVGQGTEDNARSQSDQPWQADTPGSDSNAGCRIAHQRFDRTLYADTYAVEIGNSRATVVRRCYTESAPREVLLPSGPPDRLCESRSGIFIEAAHAWPPRPPENLAHRCDCHRTFLSFGPPSMLPA